MFDLIRSRVLQNESTPEGSSEPASWLPKKKHFRETEEWKEKRSRIITKMRCLGKLNLAFIISRMPVGVS
uniref:Uncharacterized protein n=1 Tax=Acrobeloides nanus TaxID=290746 RepID=A0A914E9C2_9BILA